MRGARGFTLVEMLVAAAILSVSTVLVALALRGASGATARVAADVALVDDVRAAADLVAASAGEAVFVYAPGVTLTFGTGWTTRNFGRPGGAWRVGEDPILAFVEAPTEPDPAVPCRPEEDAPEENRASCAVFVAYYPLPRREVVARATGAGHPGDDPANPDAWTLYEYRRTLPFKSFVPFVRARMPRDAGFGDARGRLPTARAVLGGASGNLVLDRLAPGGFSVTFSACRRADGVPEAPPACPPKPRPTYLATALAATVRLQVERRTRETHLRPAVEAGVAPRNLYAP